MSDALRDIYLLQTENILSVRRKEKPERISKQTQEACISFATHSGIACRTVTSPVLRFSDYNLPVTRTICTARKLTSSALSEQ